MTLVAVFSSLEKSARLGGGLRLKSGRAHLGKTDAEKRRACAREARRIEDNEVLRKTIEHVKRTKDLLRKLGFAGDAHDFGIMLEACESEMKSRTTATV